MNDSLESARKSMPSRYEIARYWIIGEGLERLKRKMVLDLWEPVCLACNYYNDRWDIPSTAELRWDKSSLHRAHLTPKCLGGSNEVNNLTLICKACHEGAPDHIDPEEMLVWMSTRKIRSVNNISERLEQCLIECEALGITQSDVEAFASLDKEIVRQKIGQIWDGRIGTHLSDTWGSFLKPSTMALAIRDAIRCKPRAKYSELEAFNPFRNLEIYRD